MVTRRAVLRVLSSSAAAAIGGVRFETPAFAQAGAWLNAGGGDWRTWESGTGARVLRGGPGSFMQVPAGCPHAFFNPGSSPARMLFLVSPAGHEIYLQELAGLLAAGGPPDQAAIAALRRRHDIHQLTPLANHPPGA